MTTMDTARVFLNKEQGLYVIPAGSGFTCLGFDVGFDKASAVVAWMANGTPLPLRSNKGTVQGYEDYQRIMKAGYAETVRRHSPCPIELTPQLQGLEGKRVEVYDKHGERRRFWVGKSTGWMPCHLEISRRNSSGGSSVTGAPFKSVVVVTP